ncbi:hypothetical protein LPW36_07600 [Jinshanibacter sp. LJY008]|uniref:Uncharacterized protein n=1 Tax=Limnobaculum eriocheiris TaxID=2897391 RepID=A0A9X1SKN9_9GAMM|nr:hypothetical protein [Limnobaculum eriocheiris]MCD1125870.1 hypothetical protein [Limnobaculum eriocheiris]
MIGNLVNTVLGNSTVTDNVLDPAKNDVKDILASVGAEVDQGRLDDLLDKVL